MVLVTVILGFKLPYTVSSQHTKKPNSNTQNQTPKPLIHKNNPRVRQSLQKRCSFLYVLPQWLRGMKTLVLITAHREIWWYFVQWVRGTQLHLVITYSPDARTGTGAQLTPNAHGRMFDCVLIPYLKGLGKYHS